MTDCAPLMVFFWAQVPLMQAYLQVRLAVAVVDRSARSTRVVNIYQLSLLALPRSLHVYVAACSHGVRATECSCEARYAHSEGVPAGVRRRVAIGVGTSRAP